ncbi:MAG TPA: hypothetical protein VI408_04165 [Gaiellaceae bacterium]
MTRFRLELLQWYALLAGPWMWATQHVLEFGLTNSHCSMPVSYWHVPVIWLNVLITTVCGTAVVAAELAAFVVFRATSDTGKYAPGPWGRMKFFAEAALLGNVLFIVIVALDAAGAFYHGCNQA